MQASQANASGAKVGRPKKPKTRGDKVIALIETYVLEPEGARLSPQIRQSIIAIVDGSNERTSSPA